MGCYTPELAGCAISPSNRVGGLVVSERIFRPPSQALSRFTAIPRSTHGTSFPGE